MAWFERNEHERLEELRNGDEPNGEIVQMIAALSQLGAKTDA